MFQLAKEVLQRQERNVDELRGRAGVVLAGAAIGLGLLGKTFDNTCTGVQCFSLWTWVGIVSLGISLFASLWVLVPRSGWTFGYDIWKLEKDIMPLDLEKARHELILHIADMSETNEPKLTALTRGFTIASAMLAAGSAAALIDLGR